MTDPYDYQHGEYITGNDGNYEIVQYQSNNHGDINSNIFKYIVNIVNMLKYSLLHKNI